MQIDVPAEYEGVLENAVATGSFRSADEALRRALELLALDHATEERKPTYAVDWESRFRGWAARHPTSTHMVDASRAGIYGDRGR